MRAKIKDYLQTIQYIDERERCMGVLFINDERVEGQYNSHGFSYIGARKIMRDIEEGPIGLELLVEDD